MILSHVSGYAVLSRTLKLTLSCMRLPLSLEDSHRSYASVPLVACFDTQGPSWGLHGNELSVVNGCRNALAFSRAHNARWTWGQLAPN